ncbi:unnamed protein product [Rotaria sp. Silwood2]|nr:unnamed protein product [Rotaria sp. Silwood2]CAF4288041.1 unnamed protein product [Rotaria sp. Silwood2]
MEYDDNVPVINLINIDLRPRNSRPIVCGRGDPHTLLYSGAHIATGENQGSYHHDKTMARIQTTTLDASIADGLDQVGITVRPLYLVDYEDDNEEQRAQTVEHARRMLNRADAIGYDIISTNCESLAIYCRTGQWISE